MPEFDGKTVIVSGGAKGIGRGISLAFAEAGASVFSVDVDAAAGVQIERDAAGLSGNLTFVEADVADAGNCRQVVDQAVEQTGGVDILCNNVGIQPMSSYLPLHECPEEAWDRIIDVNLKSFFLLSKYSIPEMLKQGGGVIVNTASVQSLQSMKGVPAYAASKGGILSLTRQMALEYAAQNIRVLAVNPGTIDTPLVADAAAGMGEDYEALKKEWGRAHPLQRIGSPRDIAEAVMFLASDRASFMTGEYVNVDGGLMALGAWGKV